MGDVVKLDPVAKAQERTAPVTEAMKPLVEVAEAATGTASRYLVATVATTGLSAALDRGDALTGTGSYLLLRAAAVCRLHDAGAAETVKNLRNLADELEGEGPHDAA